MWLVSYPIEDDQDDLPMEDSDDDLPSLSKPVGDEGSGVFGLISGLLLGTSGAFLGSEP